MIGTVLKENLRMIGVALKLSPNRKMGRSLIVVDPMMMVVRHGKWFHIGGRAAATENPLIVLFIVPLGICLPPHFHFLWHKGSHTHRSLRNRKLKRIVCEGFAIQHCSVAPLVINHGNVG